METCYRKKVRLLTAIKIQTPVCIFLLPPEKDPRFPHKTLPALSRVLSLRRRLSGHRCVIQNSFKCFFSPERLSGSQVHDCKSVSGIFVPPEPPFGAQVCHTKQFRVFLSLRSRLSGHRCVIQNSFGYFCPSGGAFRGTGVSYKTVSNIFVPPEPPFGASGM